ncbi:hypothetical protein CFAM422_008495 [Trichoderma lentiforme]|uniref:Uncharacterized protein n=1 Tax=Trichoderma lentiforme TaxID=1567552 RepID=A0A9P4XBY8_9HYPO|nr:hypothetical protein CFAM422_008495 [Trichoderma lentiforme]
MPIGIIADIVGLIGLGPAAIGGSVITYCSKHPGPGCIDSRSVGMNLRHFDSNVGACNVPMYNFAQCHDQLESQSTGVIGTVLSAGTVQFDNIPPACMNLNAILIGACGGTGPRPEPCGSACMKYIGLSDDQLRLLSKSLNVS